MSDHFIYRLRVRYGECDGQKVVFNSRYGDYVDLAVTEYFRALGYGAELVSGELDYQLVKQTTEWQTPARFDDVLEISVSALRMGTTSFVMGCDFRLAGRPSTPIARSETVYVLVDHATLTKKALPDSLKQALGRPCNAVINHAG